MQLSRKRIRLQVDSAKIGQPIIDLNTGQTPVIFAGTDVQIEIGLFQNGALLDVGNLAHLQIDLKNTGNLLGASVLTVTVNVLDNSTSFGAWNSGVQQHALVTLSNAQTNLGIPSQQTYTLVISATTTDNPGRIIVFGSTQLTITPTGINSGGNPAPAIPTFYTGNQADARYLQLAASGQSISQPVTLAQGVILGQIPIATSPQGLTLPPLVGSNNSNTVPVGPYIPLPSTGTANFGPNAGQSSLEALNTSHFWRVRQNGAITSASFYLPSSTGLTALYAKIWRSNSAGTFDFIGQSENLAASLSAGLNTHTLATPIPNVREGDFIGFRAEWSAGAAVQNFYALNPGTSYTVLSQSSLVSTYNWAAQSSNNVAVPLQLQMAAPWFVAIGDSLMSGRPGALGYADSYNIGVTDAPQDSLPCYLGRALGLSYQNMGVSGQTTAQIAARIIPDCVALSPRFVLLEGGNNDLIAGLTAQSTISAYTTMLNACQSAGILSVLLIIPPFRNYGAATTAILTNRDLLNTSLANLAATYNAIIVDPNPLIGAPTSDGPPGNFWALQSQYDSGDGIHLNSAGYARIAQAVAQALCSLTLRGRLIAGGLALNGNLNIDGQSARKVDLDRNTNYQAAGQSLTLRAGGAFLSGPNLGGGQLILSAGIATGTGSSSILLQTAPVGSSGAVDNSPTQRLLLRQTVGFAQCNLYGDAANGAQFALYPNGGTPALALFAPATGPAGLASGSNNPQPVIGIDSSDNVMVEYSLTVGSQAALSLGGAQFNLTSAGQTRLAIQSTGANSPQLTFYNGSSFKYAIGWDQPTNKFAIYGYTNGAASPVLSVDAAGNLIAQGGAALNGNSSVAGALAVSVSASIGGSTNAAESLLYVQGNGSYINASGAVAKFMANATHGVWLGYDTANHCGLFGANTEGVSNDNLALCTQGGNLLVATAAALSGTGFSTAALQVSGNIGVNGGMYLSNGLNITASGANIVGVVTLNNPPKFAGTNTTGAGATALGSNCPALTASAPYTWLQITTSDGSTAYLPAWK